MIDVLTIHAPDEYRERWTVVGDLREIVNLEVAGRVGTGQSTNHVVAHTMADAGWGGESLDPEWSCFWGYADSEDEAQRLALAAEYAAREMAT